MNIETVFCPFCGKPLEYPAQLKGSLVQCKHCSSYFKWENTSEPSTPIAQKKELPKPANVVRDDKKDWNSSAGVSQPHSAATGSNIRSAIVIAAAIILVGVIYCATNYMGSRYNIETIDKTTYRIDRHTGEMSIVKPNGVITKAKEPQTIKSRNLSYTEMSELIGRGGPDDYRTSFSGTIYNGNGSVVVTEIEIRVTFTNDEQCVSRVYKDTTKISPLSTSRLYFSILNPGGDFKFDWWSIDGAKGYDKTSTED